MVLQELLGKARRAAEQAVQGDAYHQGLRMAYYDPIGFAF